MVQIGQLGLARAGQERDVPQLIGVTNNHGPPGTLEQWQAAGNVALSRLVNDRHVEHLRLERQNFGELGQSNQPDREGTQQPLAIHFGE
jgi:hypothetical protein